MAQWGRRWSDAPTRVRMRDLIMVCVAADPESSEALSRVTRTMPCRVLMTNDPATAFRWVEQSPVALVLAEQWLKDMPGARFLKEISRRSPQTARFLLAATPETHDQVSGEKATVHGVIGKPWDVPSLRRTILAILKWQEERNLAPYPQAGQVERRKRPHAKSDDHSQPHLA